MKVLSNKFDMRFVRLRAKGLIVLVSPNQSDRKGNNKVSKCKCKKYLFVGKKTKKNRRISLLDDYYYQTTSSVANQNAGFALVHQLGDTNSQQPGNCSLTEKFVSVLFDFSSLINIECDPCQSVCIGYIAISFLYIFVLFTS